MGGLPSGVFHFHWWVQSTTGSLTSCCEIRPPHPTEYCAQGSLYDTLKQAAAGGAIYEQLTWARRLSLVSGLPGSCAAQLVYVQHLAA